MSYKNYHNFKTERFWQKPIVTFDPCDLMSASSIIKVSMFVGSLEFCRQINKTITVTLRSAYAGEGELSQDNKMMNTLVGPLGSSNSVIIQL